MKKNTFRTSIECCIIALLVLFILYKEPIYYHLRFPAVSWSQYRDLQYYAENGDAISQLYMGVLYANGTGVKQDYSVAATWYSRAADQGNAIAQRNLALLYECGVGVKQDDAEALRWYMLAAEQNNPAAILSVSSYPFAFKESIFPRHFGKYMIWRLKAIALSQIPGHALSLEEGVWESYLAEQRLYQKDGLILDIVKKRAEQDDNEAQFLMAIFALRGQGMHFSREEVNAWMQLAARNGNPRAQFILGCYWRTTPPSDLSIIDYNRVADAAARNSLVASEAKNSPEAYFTYFSADDDGIRKLADCGYLPAIYRVLRKPESSSETFMRYFTHIAGAAEQGDDSAIQYMIAGHVLGIGGKTDCQQSIYWLRKLLDTESGRSLTELGPRLRVLAAIYGNNPGSGAICPDGNGEGYHHLLQGILEQHLHGNEGMASCRYLAAAGSIPSGFYLLGNRGGFRLPHPVYGDSLPFISIGEDEAFTFALNNGFLPAGFSVLRNKRTRQEGNAFLAKMLASNRWHHVFNSFEAELSLLFRVPGFFPVFPHIEAMDYGFSCELYCY